MPELPDIVVYMEALEQRVLGHDSLNTLKSAGLRFYAPPILRIDSIQGHPVTGLRRIGKRIAFGFDNDLWLIFHLMIAGRLHWSQKKKTADGRRTPAAFGTLIPARLLLHGSRGHASARHCIWSKGRSRSGSARSRRYRCFRCLAGAIQRRADFSQPHTQALAYGSAFVQRHRQRLFRWEILFHAQLSPVLLTQRMDREQIRRLYEATRKTLTQWTETLRTESSKKFPEKVTAFRPEMAVHGRYGKPCPVCGEKVQRIRYASNETNYCPHCQTAGKLLADRSLSRLLRQDWPKTPEELEERRKA